MTKTVKLADNTVLSVLKVEGGQRFYQNAYRDTLRFFFDPETVNFDTLAALFGDKVKTGLITLDGEHLYEDYSIRIGLQLEDEEVSPESPSAPAQYAERYIVTMAQMTYMEKLIAALLG